MLLKQWLYATSIFKQCLQITKLLLTGFSQSKQVFVLKVHSSFQRSFAQSRSYLLGLLLGADVIVVILK